VVYDTSDRFIDSVLRSVQLRTCWITAPGACHWLSKVRGSTCSELSCLPPGTRVLAEVSHPSLEDQKEASTSMYILSCEMCFKGIQLYCCTPFRGVKSCDQLEWSLELSIHVQSWPPWRCFASNDKIIYSTMITSVAGDITSEIFRSFVCCRSQYVLNSLRFRFSDVL